MAFTQADLDDAAKKRTGRRYHYYDLNVGFDSMGVLDAGNEGMQWMSVFPLLLVLPVFSFGLGGGACLATGGAACLTTGAFLAWSALALVALVLLYALATAAAWRAARPYTVRFTAAARTLRSVRRDLGKAPADARDQAVAQLDLLAERLCGVDGMMATRIGCDMIDSAAIDAIRLADRVKAAASLDAERARQSAVLAEAERRFDTPEAKRWVSRQAR